MQTVKARKAYGLMNWQTRQITSQIFFERGEVPNFEPGKFIVVEVVIAWETFLEKEKAK